MQISSQMTIEIVIGWFFFLRVVNLKINYMYRKLKRTWSHGELEYIPRFRKTFPELSKLSSEDLCQRFRELDLEFYNEKQTKVKPLTRLTLPFAIVLMLLMFIALPFVFIITGKWTYPLGEKNRILNWFRSLRLL